MKKLTSVMFAIVLVSLMVTSVFAADSAFDKYVVTANTKFIDDASTNANGGGGGKAIAFVEGYGCGYSSTNDIVAIELDFGENGADGCSMKFGYAGTKETTLSVYIDDYKSGKPAAKLSIANTGGWDIAKVTKMTEFDIEVPAGKHTVYFQFTNDQSGSISEVTFIEAAPVVKEVKAPATADIAVIAMITAAASGIGALVSKKRR